MLHVVLGLAFLIAAWAGGMPVRHLGDVGLLTIGFILIMGCATIVRLSIWIHWRIVGAFAVMLLVFIAYVLGGGSKYLSSDMPTYTVTQNIPVRIERLEGANGFNGRLRVVNTSNDMLNHVRLRCVIFYDNGTPVQQNYTGGIGSGRIQYPMGAGDATEILTELEFKKFRSNPEAANCFATEATYISRPLFLNDIRLDWSVNPVDKKNDLVVTNNSSVAVKNIQFVCVTDSGEARNVMAYPAYKNPRDETVIGVGQTVKFVETTAYWKYKSCVISNALAV